MLGVWRKRVGLCESGQVLIGFERLSLTTLRFEFEFVRGGGWSLLVCEHACVLCDMCWSVNVHVLCQSGRSRTAEANCQLV